MGQWIGIPGCNDFDEFSDMSRRISRASREDSKAVRDAGAEGSVLRGMLSGARNKDAPSLELPGLIHEIMQKMRERFATHIIRRTIDSVDYKGEKLFGMKPYLEHIMEVRMYDWEMEKLRETAKAMVQENPIASADTSKVNRARAFSIRLGKFLPNSCQTECPSKAVGLVQGSF